MTLFSQGYQCLSCRVRRFVISLPPDHRRKPLIGGAYPPVIPITNEISKDEGFQFFHRHSFCLMPPTDELLLHPCPHAPASRIVAAASTGAVHALVNSVLCDSHAADPAGVLCSTVRVDDGSPECRITPDSIGKRTLTLYGFHVCIHCQAGDCGIKTVKYGGYTELSVFCLEFGYICNAFFNGSADVKSRFSRPSDLRASRSALVIAFGLRSGRWLSPILSMTR